MDHDPSLALLLIDGRRSCAGSVRGGEESFAGTLVSDVCAADNGLDCPKQRWLVHLLCELAKLREELPEASVRAFVQPLIALFQDAIPLQGPRPIASHRL